MNNYLISTKLLLKRLVVLIIAFSICRILFLLFQWNSFSNVSLSNFIGGIRFDLSVIAYSNLLVAIAHLVPGNFKYTTRYQKILLLSFFIINTVLLATNFIDFIYYDFTGKRSTYDLITATGMEQEIMGLLPSFITQYWYVLLLFIVLMFGFFKIIPRGKFSSTSISTPKKTGKQLSILIAFIGLSILLGRGGWQKKPLRRVDAIEYGTAKNSPLILNTPFCILKTIGKKQDLQALHYFSEEKLSKIYSPVKNFSKNKGINHKNVVLIILESFGDENVSYSSPKTGNTPFLDSLITQSLYFKNGFANGRVSIDAVPSVVSGIPSIIGEPYISSTYAFNTVNTLPKILNQEGYHTSFFHGAFNGSQNFDVYSSIAGYTEYYGKNEYPLTDSSHDDGKWGIFDEEFLTFFGGKLNQFKQPFFSTVFTISSHVPFIMPKKHEKNFKKGPTRFYQTVGYTDFALKKFFTHAKKQHWYNNTLFVITADHCSSAKGFYKTKLSEYQIPIIFFDPSNKTLQGVNTKNIQQIDILPSILDYLDYNKPFISYGTSYTSSDNLIVNYINHVYHVVIDDYYFIFDGKEIIELYLFKTDTNLTHNLSQQLLTEKNKLEIKIKAYLQSFNNNTINNTLTIK